MWLYFFGRLKKKFINCNTYKIVYIIKRKGKKLRRWVKKQIIDKVVGGWHVFSKNKKEGVGSFIGLHFFWLAEEKEKKETQFRSRFCFNWSTQNLNINDFGWSGCLFRIKVIKRWKILFFYILLCVVVCGIILKTVQ